MARALILGRGKGLVLPDLTGPPTSVRAARQRSRVAPFDEAMRAILREALEAAHGRIYGPEGAAALLGLKPTTLQGKLKRYGLPRAHNA